MLKEVLFMGVREAVRLEPSQTTVVISILDQFEEHNRPTRLARVSGSPDLELRGHVREIRGPYWPDWMSEAEHRAACTWDEDRAPELVDAQRIVAFISRHHSDTEAVTLVVHCYGGVSRSAVVAQWVGVTLGVATPQLGDGIHTLEGANPRVLRLLTKASTG